MKRQKPGAKKKPESEKVIPITVYIKKFKVDKIGLETAKAISMKNIEMEYAILSNSIFN
jgi:hypothetical protein